MMWRGWSHAARITCFAGMDKPATCYLVGRQVTQQTTRPVVTLELLTAHLRDKVFQSE